MACTSPSRFPSNQWSPTKIFPWITTELDEPTCTLTSPEWVSTSRSTGPLTVRVLSNEPCGLEATADADVKSTTSAIVNNRPNFDPLDSRIEGTEFLCLFIT